MSRHIVIQYNTAKLQSQWPRIALSRLDAGKRIIQGSHASNLGLNRSDPPELWRYVVGRTAPPANLPKVEAARAAVAAWRVRRHIPSFAGDPETYQQFRRRLGKPTLRETVSALASRVQDDAGLAKHLRKLLALYDQREPRRKNSAWQQAEFLIRNWIQEPPGPQWAIRSLCVFSDLAMAKLCHFCWKKQWLPPQYLNSEPARIKKLYQRLGLVPAKPRAIRDLELRHGKLHYIPFKTATYHGPWPA